MGSYDRIKIKATNALCTAIGFLAGCALVVATLFMAANIIVRPFGIAIRYIYDLVGLSAAFASALSIPYCALKRNHSVMDIVLSKLPKKLRAFFEAFSGIISSAMIIIMIYAGGKYAAEKTRVFEKTLSSGMPTWIFRWVWVLGITLVLLALLLETIDFFRVLLGKQVDSTFDPEEAPELTDGAGDTP